MGKTNWKVEYINRHIDNKNDINVCKWVTKYLHTAYTYRKQNWDGSWLIVQPGWPEEEVDSYYSYYEPEEKRGHRSRLGLVLKSNCTMDISLHKFKGWLRKQILYIV